MLLRLVLVDLVDLVDRCANSVRVQPVDIMGIGVPFGIAPPSSSCIPLSQCKLQAVCCGGRLHATVFGKIVIFCCERASSCTNIQYFEEVSKYFCMERFLAWASRMTLPPYNYHPPSGLLQ